MCLLFFISAFFQAAVLCQLSMSKIAFQAFWFRGFCFLILCSVFKIPNHQDSYLPRSYLIQFRLKQSLDLDTQFHFSKGWSRHVKFSMNPNSFKFFNKSLKKKISTYTHSMCELFCLNEFHINKSKSVTPGVILENWGGRGKKKCKARV